jgi:hypothetical protein
MKSRWEYKVRKGEEKQTARWIPISSSISTGQMLIKILIILHTKREKWDGIHKPPL